MRTVNSKFPISDNQIEPPDDAITLSATFLCNINGNTCSVSFFSGVRRFSQPYIKMLWFREWACISQYIITPQSSVSLLIIVLVYQIDGYVSRITVRYCRFKSLPVKELRVLPTMTPSGLSIGISLKMNLCRSFFAWLTLLCFTLRKHCE